MIADPEEHVATAYTDAQYASNYPDGIQRHWWNLARNRLVLELVRSTGLQDSPWIEVGCGRGFVVHALRRAGVDCTGVELAEAVPAPGVEHFVTTGCGAEELPAAQRAACAGMLLLDVIEHIPDPVGFLVMLQTQFVNVRRVVVTVPARQEIWSNYDEHYGHFLRYSIASLSRELEQARLTVESTGYFFHAPYLAARFINACGLKRDVANRPPAGRAWQCIHRMVGHAMDLESRLVPARWPGSSAYAVCSLR